MIGLHLDDYYRYRSARALEAGVKKIRAIDYSHRMWAVNEPVPHEKIIQFLKEQGFQIKQFSYPDVVKAMEVICWGKKLCIWLGNYSMAVQLDCWTRVHEDTVAFFKVVNGFLQPYLAKSDNIRQVPVDFWYWAKQHSRTNSRLIECPTWDDIKDNYVPETAAAVQTVLDMKEPDKTGRIMLWHGRPGTGKTYAIRSLLQAWRNKYRASLIIDPEVLFNEAAYINDILMAELPSVAAPRVEGRTVNGYSDVGGDEEGEKVAGRVIIIEDAPDLLLKNSRGEASNSMARLLNLSDGILGQGLRCVFLFTTNEELEGVDPAFTRPGRCLASIQFSTFSHKEAGKWLKAHGGTGEPLDNDEGLSLAELFEMSRNVHPVRAEMDEKVGFARQR